jgi:hypothetical protein
LFQRAVAINEKSAATEPANVGRSLNNLAWLYQEQGRFAEAEPLMKRLLQLSAICWGPRMPTTGAPWTRLRK